MLELLKFLSSHSSLLISEYSITAGFPLDKHNTPTFSSGSLFSTDLLDTSDPFLSANPINKGSAT